MNGPEINVALLRFLQNNLMKLKLQGESGDETEAQVPIRRKKVKVSCIKNKNYAVAKANNASRHTWVRKSILNSKCTENVVGENSEQVTEYVVDARDTLNSIAAKHDTTPAL